MNLQKIIEEFVKEGNEEYIYNEFSFQHELGCYLRRVLENKEYKIKFEINLKELVSSCKKECDILIFDKKNNPIYAIELKYLKENCAEPRRMFQCVEDMIFMNDTVNGIKTIKETYCVVVTENCNFYQGDSNRNKSVIKMHIDNLKKEKNKKDIAKQQLEYLNEIEENFDKKPKEYPSIYEYFRENNQDAWKYGKYFYSQIKKEKPVILKECLNKQVEKIEWNPISGNNKSRYYILSFKRRY